MSGHLADHLIQSQLITYKQLKQAIAEHRRSGLSLEETMIALGFITEFQVAQYLSKEYGVPPADVESIEVEEEVLGLISREFAAEKVLIPLYIKDNSLVVAMTDPSNLLLIDDVGFAAGMNVEAHVASKRAIRMAIERCYGEVSGDNVLDEEGVKGVRVSSKERGAPFDGGGESIHRDSLSPLSTGENETKPALDGRAEGTAFPDGASQGEGETQIPEAPKEELDTEVEPKHSLKEPSTPIPEEFPAPSATPEPREEPLRQDGDSSPYGLPHHATQSRDANEEAEPPPAEQPASEAHDLPIETPPLKDADYLEASHDRRFSPLEGSFEHFVSPQFGESEKEETEELRESSLEEIEIMKGDNLAAAQEDSPTPSTAHPYDSHAGGSMLSPSTTSPVGKAHRENEARSYPVPHAAQAHGAPILGEGEPRILVVDESAVVQKILTIALSRRGYSVSVASNAMQALARLDEYVPDLIFVEIELPHIDGYKLCKIIKGNSLTRHVPVVMLSSKGGFFDRVRGKMAGADDYITKPFHPKHLLQVVEKHVIVGA